MSENTPIEIRDAVSQVSEVKAYLEEIVYICQNDKPHPYVQQDLIQHGAEYAMTLCNNAIDSLSKVFPVDKRPRNDHQEGAEPQEEGSRS
ncbi:MAG: hypothetical protein C4576_09215 [Desulfobacteraceae bacterium]|nr:MAG: hypothetical protein C4576_09215 [Desulfobacteraceae bacterium]